MKTTSFILGMYFLALMPEVFDMNSLGWYVAGALIALFLFAYLIYALVKPEKF